MQWLRDIWQAVVGFFFLSEGGETAKPVTKQQKEAEIDFEALSIDALDDMLRSHDDLVRQLATQGPQNINLMAIQIFAGLRDIWEEELRAAYEPLLSSDVPLPMDAYFTHVEGADKARDWHQRLDPESQFELAVLLAYRLDSPTPRDEWKRQVLKLAHYGDGPHANRVLFFLGGIDKGADLIKKIKSISKSFYH